MRVALVFCESLRVNVHGHRDVRVPSELLHRLDIFAICFEQRGKGVPESMPTDLVRNAGGFCSRLKMRPIQSSWPIRLLPVLGRTGEDPVLQLWISAIVPPSAKRFGEFGIHRDRFA